MHTNRNTHYGIFSGNACLNNNTRMLTGKLTNTIICTYNCCYSIDNCILSTMRIHVLLIVNRLLKLVDV